MHSSYAIEYSPTTPVSRACAYCQNEAGQPKSSLDAGVLNYSGFGRNRAFVFTAEWGASSTQRKGASVPLPIDTSFLVNPRIGFDVSVIRLISVKKYLNIYQQCDIVNWQICRRAV